MLLDFDNFQDDSDEEIEVNKKGKAKVGDEDLSKPFKEVLKCPFTRRIFEFSSLGHIMPTNAKIYDGTRDPEDHVGRFVEMGNQGEWPMPVCCRMFQQTLDGKARAWFDKLPPGFASAERKQSSINLGFISKYPQEILATEHQLRLPQPSPLVGLEIALESVKLNHLVKDVRQRGRGFQQNSSPQKGKVINMVQCHLHDQKRKTTMTDKKRMNVPITFPPVLARDLSEEALVVEDEVEEYLVWRIHVDERASFEIMFEQCFNMLHPSIRARRVGKKQAIELPEEAEPQEKVSLTKKVLVNPTYPEQLVVIGKGLSPEGSTQLKNLLKKNKNIFAWEPSYMTRVPKRIIKHSLNANLSVTPVSQKRMVFCSEKRQVITKEEAEWLEAGIVRPVKLLPAPEIDSKIEAVMGFPFKCFLDAYKGYQKVHMEEEDEEKTTFYTDQEAYVNDMVVKSKSEREMLADIAETFDNLKRINMKLNPKKCLSGVEEGKFLGYMVTSEGHRVNPAKTKDIEEMQSPRTWGRCKA
ncbi:hypothetical protein Tco_0527982 [Tanacetum coccineum]